jgi:2-polyprenyl-6-methoxyphenol hydroxylase-like FAD-dependent oxidoreductase
MKPNPRILVVGAGPTGLSLACFLAQQGVVADVVDKDDGPSEGSRALGVQTRTLELLHGLGVTDQLVSSGVELTGIEARDKRDVIWSAELADANRPLTRFPNILALPQSLTEEVLLERFRQLGGDVRWHMQLEGLSEDEAGVAAKMASTDGVTTRAYDWVIGCDGANSDVRRLLDVDFEGEPGRESWWLVADAKSSRPEADAPRMTVFLAGKVPFAVVPLPEKGHCRLLLPRVANLQDRASEPTFSLDAIRQMVDERTGVEFEIEEILWQSSFAIHGRLAATYRKGHILLAGDAAHVHSPVGGQGMNTGIQDAANLAWKLGLVARGEADDRILDTYEEERRPVAEDLLHATDRATSFMSSDNGLFSSFRRMLTKFALNTGRFKTGFARRLAMLDVSYARKDNPILDEDRDGPFEPLVNRNDEREQPRLADWRDFNRGPEPGDRAIDVEFAERGVQRRLYDYLHTDCSTLLLFDGEETSVPGYRNLRAIAKDCSNTIPGFLEPVIIVRQGEEPESLEQQGSARVILDADGYLHRAYHARSECLYLVRPDLYIGFRSQPADKQSLIAHINSLIHPEPLAS